MTNGGQKVGTEVGCTYISGKVNCIYKVSVKFIN